MKRENVSGGANNPKFKIKNVTVSLYKRQKIFFSLSSAFTSIFGTQFAVFLFCLPFLPKFPIAFLFFFAHFTFNFSVKQREKFRYVWVLYGTSKRWKYATNTCYTEFSAGGSVWNEGIRESGRGVDEKKIFLLAKVRGLRIEQRQQVTVL